MFRFIHAADPHLDSPLKGLENHEGAPVGQLRGATRRAFENLVQLAIDQQVAFLVISGDVYDGDWKDYSTGLFFRGQTARLNENRIPVYLIAGNHDAASVISKKLTLPDNVHVFSTRSAESMEIPSLPVVIHGRGFPNRAVPENLVAEYPDAVPEKFNLGILHTSLTGRPGHDTYAPCTEADLRSKGYDYWALGHIHQPDIISQDPWIVFAGNCQGRHAKETGPRGCRLVTVSDALKVETVEFCPLDVVRWQELQIDLTDVRLEPEALNRASELMGRAVAEAEGRLIAVRMVVVGTTILHGSLHRERERWRAEFLAKAQDRGADSIWIERIELATAPIYNVADLAARDPLTKLVVDDLNDAGREFPALPMEVEELLTVLPPEIRDEVQREWSPENRGELLNDVRAIILDALGTKGGSGS